MEIIYKDFLEDLTKKLNYLKIKEKYYRKFVKNKIIGRKYYDIKIKLLVLFGRICYSKRFE